MFAQCGSYFAEFGTTREAVLEAAYGYVLSNGLAAVPVADPALYGGGRLCARLCRGCVRLRRRNRRRCFWLCRRLCGRLRYGVRRLW